jgi:hypothetical protein
MKINFGEPDVPLGPMPQRKVGWLNRSVLGITVENIKAFITGVPVNLVHASIGLHLAALRVAQAQVDEPASECQCNRS